MKMLKKLAALILAATMVLVLFTACGGDGGSTGTREPDKEKEMIATINKEKLGASTLSNDPALCAVAEGYLDKDLSVESNFLDGMFKGKIHVDGSEEDEYLVVTVTTQYSYGKVLTKLVKFIEGGIEQELPDNVHNLKVNSNWVKAGVVVKTTRGDSYMAVAFQIKNPKK